MLVKQLNVEVLLKILNALKNIQKIHLYLGIPDNNRKRRSSGKSNSVSHVFEIYRLIKYSLGIFFLNKTPISKSLEEVENSNAHRGQTNNINV